MSAPHPPRTYLLGLSPDQVRWRIEESPGVEQGAIAVESNGDRLRVWRPYLGPILARIEIEIEAVPAGVRLGAAMRLGYGGPNAADKRLLWDELELALAPYEIEAGEPGVAAVGPVRRVCAYCQVVRDRNPPRALEVPREEDLLAFAWGRHERKWACPTCRYHLGDRDRVWTADPYMRDRVLHEEVTRVFSVGCDTCATLRPDAAPSRTFWADETDLDAQRWRRHEDGWTCRDCRKVTGEIPRSKPVQPPAPVTAESPQERLAALFGSSSTDVAPTLTAAELIFSDLRFDGIIERGGHAAILAASRNDETEVAVKVLSRHARLDPEKQARLELEVVALRRLDHPNIVRLLDYRDDGQVQGIVMERVHGASLRAHFLGHGGRTRPGREDAIEIVRAVCSALEHAHANGVVHRDVKPENVLLAEDAPGAGRVKLVDFGIAKILDIDWQLTEQGVGVGTSTYQAPEQQSESRDVDARADVWAVGVLLHELLFEKTPRRDGDGAYVCPNPTEPLVGVLARALALDRADRFATIAALDAAISSAIEADGGG